MAKTKHIEARDLICNQLEKGEISYSSLPRKWKRDYSVIVRSKFDDIYKYAPKGLWGTRDFIKAVLVVLKKETNTEGFNLNHFKAFVKMFKLYNNVDSKIGCIVIINFSNYDEYSEMLLNILHSD